jgi:hypothetical protein
MNIEATVVADSIAPNGIRLSTLCLKYPRFIHAEFMTHRVFSRNASSSRAIPVSKVLAQVWNDPAMPVYWGANQAGMQAATELTGSSQKVAQILWRTSGKFMCSVAWLMIKCNLHKQIANRILEPWQRIHVVVTATEWNNFFLLRDHPAAQPEIRELAQKVKKAMEDSYPVDIERGDWHLPYITQEEKTKYSSSDLLKMSTARCARVSYLTHEGKQTTLEDDIKLHQRLVGAEPRHSSPAEHQATPLPSNKFSKNFKGWYQYRAALEDQAAPSPQN